MTALLRTLATASLLALLTAGAAPAQPTVLYVDAAASGANDGASWADAFVALQDAFDAANRHPGTDYTIRVAAGVYYPDEDAMDSDGTGGLEHTPGDRSASFTLARDGVTVEGGYPSGGGLRDPAAHPTVLSGDLAGDDVTNADGVTETADDLVGLDNAFHVVQLEGGSITAATVLDGLIITAGMANGSSWEAFGGGLYCDALGAGTVCSPTLVDVTLAGSSANQSTGGLYVNARDGGEGSPTLTRMTFSGHLRGALTFSAFNGGTVAPMVTDVAFTDNVRGTLRMDGRSGGTATGTFTDVTFTNNAKPGNGGAVELFTASATFTNAVFTDNQARDLGGAIYALSFDPVDLVIEASTFTRNTAGTFEGVNGAGSGGAVYHNRAARLTLDRVTFAGNEALDGGAVASADAELTATNTVFTGNRAIGTLNPRGQGGALWIRSASATSDPAIRLTNVTLAGNEANAEGGALYVDATFAGSLDVRLANSILFGNRADADGVGGGDGDPIFNTFEADTDIRYTLIEGSSIDEDGDGDNWNDAFGTDGGGNLDADPRFADADGADDLSGTADDDLRVRGPGGNGFSPAIDAGDNAAVPLGFSVDRTGLPRFVDVPGVPDTGAGPPPLVDLGAHESGGAPLPVELVAFTAATDGPRVALSWTTASEQNNAGFEVQHRAGPDAASSSAGTWTSLAFVAGRGTTPHAQQYDYRTDALPPGTHAFRLRQIDTDGTARLSEVVSVPLGLANRITLMPPTPHPARGTTTLQFGLRGGGPATLHLYNVMGQRVATLYDDVLPAATLQTVRLDTQRLATGVYFVRLVGDRDIQTRRLVIVR